MLGIPVAAGSVAPYAVTFTTLMSAMLLPIVGAIADRTSRKRHLLAGFAWAGAASAASMFLVAGLELGSRHSADVRRFAVPRRSLVVNDAILCEIAAESERDQVSSRGWALGYLGGGLLLAANLVLVTVFRSGCPGPTPCGSVCSLPASGGGVDAGALPGPAGPAAVAAVAPGPSRDCSAPRSGSCADAQACAVYPADPALPHRLLVLQRRHPDGDLAASIYAAEQLGLAESHPASPRSWWCSSSRSPVRCSRRVSAAPGASARSSAASILWTLVVGAGILPAGAPVVPFLCSRAHRRRARRQPGAVPFTVQPAHPTWQGGGVLQPLPGRRTGHELVGTLASVWYSSSRGSYRNAILVLIMFFVVGFVLLSRVDVQRGIVKAGNEVPAVV